jgi:hypothetical protein
MIALPGKGKGVTMPLGKALGNLGCVVGQGLLAGLAGTAAITLSQAVEMSLTGRPPSSTPAEAVEKVLGIRAVDEEHKAQLAQMVHWGYGTAWGLFRGFLDLLGLQGAEASVVHGIVIWGAATALLPELEVAPPAREWPVKMHAIEGTHHFVYALAVGLAYDLMTPQKSRQPRKEERRETRLARRRGWCRCSAQD